MSRCRQGLFPDVDKAGSPHILNIDSLMATARSSGGESSKQGSGQNKGIDKGGNLGVKGSIQKVTSNPKPAHAGTLTSALSL